MVVLCTMVLVFLALLPGRLELERPPAPLGQKLCGLYQRLQRQQQKSGARRVRADLARAEVRAPSSCSVL